jgi:hypothetical protein
VKQTILPALSQGRARMIVLQQPDPAANGACNVPKARRYLLRQIGQICSTSCSHFFDRIDHNANGPFCFLAIFASTLPISSVCQRLETAGLGRDICPLNLQILIDEDLILGKKMFPLPYTPIRWRRLPKREKKSFWGKQKLAVTPGQNQPKLAHDSEHEESSSDESTSTTGSNQTSGLVSPQQETNNHSQSAVTNLPSNHHNPEEYVPPPATTVAYENRVITGLSLTLNESLQDDYEPPEVDLRAAPTQSDYKINHEINGPPADTPSQSQLTGFSAQNSALQVRYFGISDDALIHCLCCGAIDHSTRECSAMRCETCGAAGEHFLAACPLNKRCSKCREVGHDADSCSAKLKLSAITGDANCLLCAQRGHFEDECALLWTTFAPDPTTVSQGSPVQPMCYQCGSSRHWGDDCPMRNRRANYTSNSFSLRYASLISPIQAQNGSTRQVPEWNSDENDDDFNFLHARKVYQKPTGISMNISLNNAAMNDHTRGSHALHPPPPPFPDSTNSSDDFSIRGRANVVNYHSSGTNNLPPITIRGSHAQQSMTSGASHHQPTNNTNRSHFQPPLPKEPPPPFLTGSREEYPAPRNYRPHPLPAMPSRRARGSSYSSYRGRRH